MEVVGVEVASSSDIPDSYRLPSLDVRNMWSVWFRGSVFKDVEHNVTYAIKPLYKCSAADLKQKKDKDSLSKMRQVIKFLVPLDETHDQLANLDSGLLFYGTLDRLCREKFGVGQINTSSKVSTMYDKIREIRGEKRTYNSKRKNVDGSGGPENDTTTAAEATASATTTTTTATVGNINSIVSTYAVNAKWSANQVDKFLNAVEEYRWTVILVKELLNQKICCCGIDTCQLSPLAPDSLPGYHFCSRTGLRLSASWCQEGYEKFNDDLAWTSTTHPCNRCAPLATAGATTTTAAVAATKKAKAAK